MKIYVVVVCYNPGEKLKATLDSIYNQTYEDIEIIIKDGDSTDGALKGLKEEGYFSLDKREAYTQLYIKKDKGIYDAMNNALHHIPKDNDTYVIFINCGDGFASPDVLTKVSMKIKETQALFAKTPIIFYGDQIDKESGRLIASNPKLDEFALYRNVPCHQVCIYDARLFDNRQGEPYQQKYKVRADYEHFLYCIYEKKADTQYLDMPISYYEGGGFSESKENIEISRAEHREITLKYMGRRAKRYRIYLALSLQGLRQKLSKNPISAGIYNNIKGYIYSKK